MSETLEPTLEHLSVACLTTGFLVTAQFCHLDGKPARVEAFAQATVEGVLRTITSLLRAKRELKPEEAPVVPGMAGTL